MPLMENSPVMVNAAPAQGLIIPGHGPTLITPQGDPIPPDDVVRELAAVDPDLKIEWVNGAWGTSAFTLKQRWRRNDPRWERVQRGEVSEAQAFDIVTRFPRETRTGDMVAWVRQRWGERAISKDPRAEAERLIAEAQRLMQQADAQNVDRAVDIGTQKALDDTDHQREVRAGLATAAPMVSGTTFAPADAPKRLLEKV